jgi:lon-related putative ATP-dependent protease
MATEPRELTPEQLRRTCDPSIFPFKSTADIPPLEGVIGQDRALGAVRFGIHIKSQGYHMYALGPVGTGKRTIIRKFLVKDAANKPVPDDWLYVNNFEDEDKPHALRLPAGKGREFRDDMDHLVEDLKSDVPRAFEGKEYEQEREKIEEEFQNKSKRLFEKLNEKAQERDFGLVQTPQGLMIVPVKKGELLTPDELEKLSEKEQQRIEHGREELQEEMRETMRLVQELQKEGKKRARELDRRVVGFAVDHLIDDFKEKYAEHEGIGRYLEEARAFLLKNVHTFRQIKQMEEAPKQQRLAMAMMSGGRQPSFDEYRVNLIVDNSEAKGAPVCMESNPTGPNLIGRIEHMGQFGALVTNFRMIKGGALHVCNGGYLMLDVFDVLTKPLAWHVLKRALKNREIEIESMGEAYGLITTRTLQPEPIPLDIKVILIGDPFIYYLLYNHDPDFQELFKVKADFETRIDWDDETAEQYAHFIGSVCREEGLKHFAPSGVSKVVEYGSRLTSHRRKVATKFGEVVDLVRQASYWAGTNGNEFVQGEDVKKAIDEQIYRSNRIEERLREMIEEGTIFIDTEGEVVGQVNGLAVLPIGDYAFGKPSRVTARTHMGSNGVVNIDREAKLGGRIHNKGTMILSGYLGGKYALNVPLTLSASITFEQLYEGVEGDSASSTELYALLSSLSELPIRQELAVTGSVNQRGEVQAIGGVNEKIESFFEVCRAKGLTGSQGVMIPAANCTHLMLREHVVAAVAEGKFHIYPVATIDEGITLLTGTEAGERQDDGSYPEGTINSLVQGRIRELAEKAKAFGKEEGEEENEEEEALA